MSSAALVAFGARVDASALPDRDKATVKGWGEALYSAASLEAVVHVRLHANAVVNDAGEPQTIKEAAQQVLAVTAPLAARTPDDPRWLGLLRP